MTDNSKKITVKFAPGCFDNFDGTQEELNELIKHIQEMAASGELSDRAKPISEEDFEDMPDEFIEWLVRNLNVTKNEVLVEEQRKRTLN